MLRVREKLYYIWVRIIPRVGAVTRNTESDNSAKKVMESDKVMPVWHLSLYIYIYIPPIHFYLYMYTALKFIKSKKHDLFLVEYPLLLSR